MLCFIEPEPPNYRNLGGLYKTMPVTMILCVVGAASISAFPLFSGFISKSLVLDAAHIRGGWIVWGMLLVASVGVLCHSGIKVPFFTFFSHDSGKRPQEAPQHMLWAMGICAVLCIGIGVFPGLLYSILPYDVEFHPYTSSHVVAQLQLLCFAILSFCLLKKSGAYPEEVRAINLNSDWLYLRAAPVLLKSIFSAVSETSDNFREIHKTAMSQTTLLLGKIFRPRGLLSKGLNINTTILIVTIMMSIILFLNLFYIK